MVVSERGMLPRAGLVCIKGVVNHLRQASHASHPWRVPCSSFATRPSEQGASSNPYYFIRAVFSLFRFFSPFLRRMAGYMVATSFPFSRGLVKTLSASQKRVEVAGDASRGSPRKPLVGYSPSRVVAYTNHLLLESCSPSAAARRLASAVLTIVSGLVAGLLDWSLGGWQAGRRKNNK